MSWRLLFATLLVALGVAAWGGIQLGDWLVAHAPQAAPAPGQEKTDWSQQPVLDADGRPYVAQPPQPRVDGTLGVPDGPAHADWEINTVSLFDTVTDPNIRLSRDQVSMEEARELARSTPATPPGGSSDVSTLDLQAFGGSGVAVQQAPNTGLTQQPQIAQAPVAPPHPQSNQGNWQQALRSELSQCATKGFFERPTCAWNARNKYCAPNRAWGSVNECPARN